MTEQLNGTQSFSQEKSPQLWIEERILNAFRHLKIEKLQTSLVNPENQSLLNQFCTSTERRFIIVTESPSGITLSTRWKENARQTKAFYIAKLHAAPFNTETNQAFCGEVVGGLLTYLEKVSNMFYMLFITFSF